jgi:hypothetical protein
MQLIVECDATAHHIISGSMDINPQEELPMKYFVTTNLNILYKDYEHAFVISERKEVTTDLILGTDKTGDLVTNWHVSHELSQ